MNANGVIDLNGMDRVTRSATTFVMDQGVLWQVSESWVYPVDNDSTAVSTGSRRVQLTGLESGVIRRVGSPQNPITQTLAYNARNELTGSQRDDSAALTRTYAYDPVGNRTGATQNEAPNADTITYVRNALNQYKQVAATGQGGTLKQGLSYDEDGNLVERFIAGDMDCDGDVDMDDIDPFVVALEGQAAYETAYPDCEYLHADVNGDGVVDFDDLDVFLGLVSSGNAALWVAYAWDAENRLIGVAPAGTPKSGDLKLAFVYDYMGRRVEKKVWTWDPQAGQGGAWVLTGHRKFVWNGWLLLMELDGLNDDAILRKRTWGLDLAGLTGGGSSAGLASSRSMLEGAGGIGGLLAVYDTNGTTTGENPEADDMAYVYFYDANGNVGQVCDLSHTTSDPAGAIVARYEYDPYGNVTSQSGTYAAANPFRFSTKYWDDETGLGYWGYRYYDPKLGRWVNRDPIGEVGGVSLYAYVGNDPCGVVDSLGRYPWLTGTWSLDSCNRYCQARLNACLAALGLPPGTCAKDALEAGECFRKHKACTQRCQVAQNCWDGPLGFREIPAEWFDPWEDDSGKGRVNCVKPLPQPFQPPFTPPRTWPAPSRPRPGNKWVTCTWFDAATGMVQMSQIQCGARRSCAGCCAANNPVGPTFQLLGCEDTPYFE